jgi:hypothetical protein
MNSRKMQKIGIVEAYMPIDDFPNYEVSNYGNVRNKKTNKVLKPGIDTHGYYYVNLCDGINKPKNKLVHRMVAEAFLNNSGNKKCVDHIDNDPLNNCDFNLRYATTQENAFNSSMQSNNTSGVKGISWNKEMKKWRAQIMINRKHYHLGYFDDLEDAKKARQKKARELFGEFMNKCEL